MMRLAIDLEDAVRFWPELDEAEYNYVDRETLAEVCDRLGLRRVLPLQLAASKRPSERSTGASSLFRREKPAVAYNGKRV